MASILKDSEEQRSLERIRCSIIYGEVWNEMIAGTGDSFITRQWISEKLHRDESWVRRTWNKTAEECFTQFEDDRSKILSQDSKNIVACQGQQLSKNCKRSSGENKTARN